MRRHRNAKIVATLGPASASEDIIRSLFLAGVDVFRLNFSHGSHDAHPERLQQIRNVERSVGRPIGVLADIQGPKLCVGTFAAGPVALVVGSPFRLDLANTPGDAAHAYLPHPEIFEASAHWTAAAAAHTAISSLCTTCSTQALASPPSRVDGSTACCRCQTLQSGKVSRPT